MLEERYDLVIERIRSIWKEPVLAEPFCSYFEGVASFVLLLNEIYPAAKEGRIKDMQLEEISTEEVIKKIYEGGVN